jgi:hypothetical protein
MDLMRSRVALRERALLDVLDLAVRFCAVHARAYANLSLFVLLPAFAVSCAVSRAGWWFGWLATVVMTSFAGAPFVALASRLVFADEVGTREALRLAVRAFPRLVAVRALQALALVSSVLLFGMPWLWVGTILLFVVEVLVLEQQGGVRHALGRAQRIASARFGAAIAAMLLLAAAPIAAAMVADVAGREVLGGVLEIKPPPPMFSEGGSWLALAGWWATLPLLSTARFFVYLDIRTRAEGWDIQTRFAAIAARANAQTRATTERALRPSGAVLLVLALLAVPRDARAAGVNPSHGQADVDRAMAEHSYAFCREPAEPLTFRARSLCAHATKIPDCTGFAAACARAQAATGERSARRWWDDSAPRTVVARILGALARTAVWLLVAAVVAAVLIPIARAVARLRRRARVAGDHAPGPGYVDSSAVDPPAASSEETLLAHADDLARRGDNAAALELYLAAALRALDKRGAVLIAKDRTNGEYVRSCADEGAKPALRTMVRDVDRVKFGGEDASAESVRCAARYASALVRALPIALLALALSCSLGCGAGAAAATPREGDDPAGDELWYEVLRGQGIRAEPLETALASLALPTQSERSPAVVIDLERTELDADTREHLVRWVEAGGALVLAGRPEEWPREFGATPSTPAEHGEIAARRLLARPLDEEDGKRSICTDQSRQTETNERAQLATGVTIGLRGASERVAWFDNGAIYAATVSYGRGHVLGVASDELMTNVGLARAGNAAAMLAIFSNADRVELRVAQEDDGVAPPSSPIAALSRAGLGLGLVHALVASLALFLAVGMRLTRPKPSPQPRRRAFGEHVEAVGALYARARAAPHALAAYTRFVEGRFLARMLHAARPRLLPRRGQDSSAPDVASFLASRSRLPVDACRRLWARAMAAKEGAEPQGDELAVLEELSAACVVAMARDGAVKT